jgi:Putative Ig domain
VSPALPAGLTLDEGTGTRTGTPTAVNAQGTAKINLEVNDGPLFYTSPVILVLGTVMTPLTHSGTTYLSAYSVFPALPIGVLLTGRFGSDNGCRVDFGTLI